MTDSEYLVMWFCQECFEEHYFSINSLPGGEEHCPYCEHCGGKLIPEDDMTTEAVWATGPVYEERFDMTPGVAKYIKSLEQENGRLRERVQALEAACNQAITDCVPLLSWVYGDDIVTEMVMNIANSLGAATAEGGE